MPSGAAVLPAGACAHMFLLAYAYTCIFLRSINYEWIIIHLSFIHSRISCWKKQITHSVRRKPPTKLTNTYTPYQPQWNWKYSYSVLNVAKNNNKDFKKHFFLILSYKQDKKIQAHFFRCTSYKSYTKRLFPTHERIPCPLNCTAHVRKNMKLKFPGRAFLLL